MRHIRLVFVLVSVFLAGFSRADHFSGASVTYACQGGNTYMVYLDLYLDCAGAAITPQTLNFSNSCGVVFTRANLVPTSVEVVSPACPAELGNTVCDGGTLPGIRRYRFEVSVFLSPCNFWTISWSICCRANLVNLANVPGIYAQATLNNTGGLCDASPVFEDSGILYVCAGQPVVYNPGVSDPNGHTMQFALVSASFGTPAQANVLYAPGYSGAQPIPGITIDPATGQLSFTTNTVGSYVIVIEVTTFTAAGVLIGRVMRDFIVVVRPCDDPPPSTQGLSNLTNGILVSPNAIQVCNGASFCVDVVFVDPVPATVLTVISNTASQLPGATFTTSGTNPLTVTLCWTADVAQLPRNIFIQVSDNACPISNQASTSILITGVLPTPITPNAGTNGILETCPGFPTVGLITLLGGTPDPGGSWTAPNGTFFSGTFVPGVSAVGVYTYYAGNACNYVTSTVTVSSGSPNPGSNGSLAFCANGAPAPLLSGLGGSPAPGGTWSGPSPVVGGIYDPVTMTPGVYTYSVVGGTCPPATATVTVTESNAPNAGTNGTLNLCSTSPATALLSGLGGTPGAGGAWTGPSVVTGGLFNPATMTAGVYTYTITGIAPCVNSSATVTVVVNSASNAGTNGTLTLCSTSASVPLVNSLGGAPQVGGAWTGPSPVVGGIYDPATMAPGAYLYTVTGVVPCPNATATVTVTENAAPNAGTNGTLTLCSNSPSTALLSGLGGTPSAGGAWTGPSAVVGGLFNPATMTAGVYTYTVTGVAPCTNATATVTVTVNPVANAGTNGTLTLCSNSPSTALLSGLGGTPSAGGAWTGPSAVVGGLFNPATMTAGVYTYSVTGVAPCTNATATVTVTVNPVANAGTNGALTLCSNSPSTALLSGLGGTPSAGGAWTGPSAVVGGQFDPATMTAGVYTYSVTGVAPCTNATATVTVTVNPVANAGTNGTLTLCSNSPSTALLSGLGGTPSAGGAWTGPSAVVGGQFDPATMTAGVYTYTVTGVAPCTNATATVTVTVNPVANAGTNGTLTLCSNSPSTALLSGLGGTPSAGGAWTGPSAVVGGQFDPATMTAGVYTYTVTGVAPCTNATATVTVTVNPVANAGTNGALTLCSNSPSTALLSGLGGTPSAGGAWTGPSAVVGGQFDPATMTAGVYTYSVTGVAPCTNATATVTVTVNPVANAGTNGALTLCSNSPSTALLSGLGGTPSAGGAWTGPSAVVGGQFDPATMTAGVYTYTVTGVAPCTNATATVTVTVNPVANAGTNGTLTLCSNSPSTALLSGLGGTPSAGGAWTGPSAVVGGQFDPATMTAGVYTYTVTGVAPCTNATATVTVTVNPVANAGTNGTLTLCSNSPSTALLSGLGGTPSAGGAWTGPSAVVGGQFDPATMTAGVYTYTVTGVAPCTNATATVTVTVNPVANAGTNGTLTLCSNSPSTALLSGLGGTPSAGGAWTGPSAVVGGQFDPATMTAGVYTYTVTGVAPCTNATATVTVTVNPVANAGTNGALTLCSNSPSAALLSGLGGTPSAGGAWTGPSAVVGGQFDPATMTAGVYTYTVTGVAPCTNATATVTVTVNPVANAGTNGALTLCSNSPSTALLSGLGGTPSAGGAWTGPSAVVGGQFDPATMTAGVYTYSVTGVAPCTNATATVTVTVNPVANAGTNGTLTLCSNSPSTALLSGLGGTPSAGGAWTGPSAVVGGQFDPATMTAGVYTYTVTGVAPCTNATATVTVTVNPVANAGTNGTLTLCSNSPSTALLSGLGGTPSAGGAWTGPSAVVGGQFDPATMTAGVYTYTVTGVQHLVRTPRPRSRSR
jgi:hypothetical protein